MMFKVFLNDRFIINGLYMCRDLEVISFLGRRIGFWVLEFLSCLILGME